jgi:hypothetical protein
LIFLVELLNFFLLKFIFLLGFLEGLLAFIGLLHFIENLLSELLNLLLGEESGVDNLDAVLHSVNLVFDHVGEVFVFGRVPQQLDKLTSELAGILWVFGMTRLHKTTQARDRTFTDFEVARMVAERNNDIEGFIDVGAEILAHLINDDRQHVDGDGGFFGVVGLEVLSLVVVAILAYEHLLQETEDMWQDLGQVVAEIVTHHQHQTLVARKEVGLLGVRGFESCVLELDHHLDGLFRKRTERLEPYSVSHNGQHLDDHATQLTVFLLRVRGHHLEEELNCVLVVGDEVLAGSFGKSTHGADYTLFSKGACILENFEKTHQERLEVLAESGISEAFHKISQTSGGVGLYSGH